MREVSKINQEIEALENLKVKTDAYIKDAFDFLSGLNSTHTLTHLYDLKHAIDLKIAMLNQRKEQIGEASDV